MCFYKEKGGACASPFFEYLFLPSVCALANRHRFHQFIVLAL